MATYIEADDPLVTCPYNPAHRQKKSRLQMHITKCRKNYPEEDLKTCPFNAQHRIQEGEFKHHMLNCPDRSIVDKHLTKKEGTTYKGRTAVPSYTHDSPPKAEIESWDDELVNRGYQPKTRIKGKFCDDAIRYMSPSERKKYYEQLMSPNDKDSNEEKEEEKKTPKTVTTVKTLRQPLEQPEALNILRKEDKNLIHQIGLGRGMSLPNRRIAASIFGLQNMATPGQQASVSSLSSEFQNMSVKQNANSDLSLSNDDSVQSFGPLVTNYSLGIGRGSSKRTVSNI